ncbi:MAG: hypothetical protein JNJ86_16635 [Chitinophagaceae bacterium]|nr:hypothetical protein [Chitinophagaceae bacterium]
MKGLNWIETAGGPFIIISDSAVKSWSGIYKRDLYLLGNIRPAENFMDSSETDYGKACSIADYLGFIQIKNESALILGDEPLPTTFFKSSDTEVGIARIYNTDNRDYLDEWLLNLNISTIDNWKFNFTINFNSDKQYLFDAAIDGKRLENQKRDNDFLSVQLTPGQYKVFTTTSEPSSSTKLFLIRLVATN